MSDVVAQLGDSGITLGGVDAAGVRWKWGVPSVLGPKPAGREETGDRAYNHGQWDATRFYGPRTRDIAGSARVIGQADPLATLADAEQRLRDAVGLEPFDLILTEPGRNGAWVQRVRQAGDLMWTVDARDDRTGYAHATFSIGLYAPDPLTYAAASIAQLLRFPTTSGGLTVPFTVPFTIDATTVTGRLQLSNPGNLPLPLQLTLTGPVGIASLADPDTGDVMLFRTRSGLPLLGAGETLEVDTGRHTVLSGGVPRRSSVGGTFLMLTPDRDHGGPTTLALSGTGTTADSSVQLTYTPARI